MYPTEPCVGILFEDLGPFSGTYDGNFDNSFALNIHRTCHKIRIGTEKIGGYQGMMSEELFKNKNGRISIDGLT